MKKLVSLFFSLALLIFMLPVSQVYADDISGITLEKEMRDMINRGVIYGYEEGIYAPNEKVNRGQFATFLSRALDLPKGKHQFPDVSPSSKLAEGINAAAAAGIISGYPSGQFGLNDLITREQMAIMIDKSLDYLKITKVKGALTFADEATIESSGSRLAISYMVGLKIIAGYPNPNGSGTVFKPKNEATRAEAAAFLSRMLNLDSTPAPTPPVTVHPYRVGTVSATGTITPSTNSYKTFTEASRAITNSTNQVILKNNKVVKMRYGLAVSNPGAGNATTIVYESDMKTIYAPISKGNELEYVTSDDSKVTVKVAGRTGYVKHEDITLIPSQALKGRSYYSVNTAGDLVHTIFNHDTASTSSYIAGKAPSALKQGMKYISWDGATFETENGATVGTFYQYFNMLPIRTSTKYSAAELDKYIATKLAEVEALYKKNPSSYAKYKDATKKSKLIGLGTIAKNFETYHKINALVIVGMGILESEYGMSNHAQNNNNIFGIKVYDSNPQNGEAYASIRDCVSSLVTNYLNKNYIPVDGAFANGGMLGNKARGMNVRYASDPYWGQKIAGHIYQLEKALGGKDYLKSSSLYKIYETTTEGVNVRSTAGVTNTNKLYTYPKAGYPVATVDESLDSEWHKILSDSKSERYGFISAQYTKILPIAK
ncbi:S-layer homology domain-containing protein [Bacillus massiliigorillae]|uniref:S-layer homology domain-containing protein n=1 Tax=Bacillus massiliigorillae TaxID=1243664 RepID=UPI00039D882F|nr:S-layer homology domain-containing protein [Bacillus massiliigorillae]